MDAKSFKNNIISLEDVLYFDFTVLYEYFTNFESNQSGLGLTWVRDLVTLSSVSIHLS